MNGGLLFISESSSLFSEETKYSDESGNANEEISTETEDVQQPQFTYNELIQKLERLENTNSRISYLRITCKDPLISGLILL